MFVLLTLSTTTATPTRCLPPGSCCRPPRVPRGGREIACVNSTNDPEHIYNIRPPTENLRNCSTLPTASPSECLISGPLTWCCAAKTIPAIHRTTTLPSFPGLLDPLAESALLTKRALFRGLDAQLPCSLTNEMAAREAMGDMKIVGVHGDRHARAHDRAATVAPICTGRAGAKKRRHHRRCCRQACRQRRRCHCR